MESLEPRAAGEGAGAGAGAGTRPPLPLPLPPPPSPSPLPAAAPGFTLLAPQRPTGVGWGGGGPRRPGTPGLTCGSTRSCTWSRSTARSREACEASAAPTSSASSRRAPRGWRAPSAPSCPRGCRTSTASCVAQTAPPCPSSTSECVHAPTWAGPGGRVGTGQVSPLRTTGTPWRPHVAPDPCARLPGTLAHHQLPEGAGPSGPQHLGVSPGLGVPALVLSMGTCSVAPFANGTTCSLDAPSACVPWDQRRWTRSGPGSRAGGGCPAFLGEGGRPLGGAWAACPSGRS